MRQNQDLAPFRPRIARLTRRCKRRAARAMRRREHQAAAGYTRAAAYFADALAHIPEPMSQGQQAQADRAELYRRLSVLVTEENQAEARATLDALCKDSPSPPEKGERAG